MYEADNAAKRAVGKVAARSGDIMLAAIFAGQLSFATQKSHRSDENAPFRYRRHRQAQA